MVAPSNEAPITPRRRTRSMTTQVLGSQASTNTPSGQPM